MLSSTQRGLAGPEVNLKGDLAVLVIPGPGIREEILASWLLVRPPPPLLSPSYSLRVLLSLQVTPKCSVYHLCLLTQQVIKGDWFGNHI